MEISTDFCDKDYVPFTTGELILERLVPFDTDKMGALVGADFNGLYVRAVDGSIKKALYNTMTPHSSTYEAQQPYRDSIRNNFELALSEVAKGETLVLLMFGREGWSVEATRVGPHFRFAFKRSPLYKPFGNRKDGEFIFSGEAGSEPMEIILRCKDIVRIQGELIEKPWTHAPLQQLRLYREDGSMIGITLIPRDEFSENCEDQYRCVLNYYESDNIIADQKETIHATESQFWDLVQFLNGAAHGIPVE